MKISIVIPAKGTSERLENKNLLRINGKSLTQLACEKVLECKNINNVFIDTESDKIKEEVDYLLSNGLSIIHRPSELANNSINANDLLVYALHSIPYCDLILQTFVTSPMITAKTIDSCIEKFLKTDRNDAFLTTSIIQEYFWDNNNNKPVNFDLKELPNSSNLDPLHMETHGLYGIYSKALLKNKTRFGSKTMLIPINKIESIDINTKEDFDVVNALLSQ